MKDWNEVKILPATTHDIPEIRRLAFAIWPTAYGEILTRSQIDYMLDLFYAEEALTIQFLSHHFFLARSDQQNAGFASFSVDEEKNLAKLHKLYVLSGFQGKGVGRILLDRVVLEAAKAEATLLELNVNRQNPAIAFYEKYGFVKNRLEDIDIGNGYWMNDYVMRYKVT